MPRLPAAEIISSWRDETGSRSQVRLHRATFDAAADIAAASSMFALMGGISGATCYGFNVLYSWHLTDLRPAAGAFREWVAVLIFATATAGQLVEVRVPGIAGDLVEAEPGQPLDTESPALALLVNSIIAAGFCNPFGYAATELIAAYIEFAP